jgi:hypothetical protein
MRPQMFTGPYEERSRHTYLAKVGRHQGT